MLENFVLNQITGISFHECWTNCEQRSLCKSINYKRRFHLCVLNTAREDIARGIRLTEAVACVYKSKDDESSSVQTCGDKVCSDGEVCSESNNCEIQECPVSPTVSSDVQIFGNMMSCGNKRKIIIKCREVYRPLAGKETITTECLNNGKWNETLNCSKALNCKNRFDDGDTTTGIKAIYPDDVTPVKALCVMDEDGGGWTVIQKRETASDFYKGWQEYRDGFGDDTNFWLGLENIYRLTAQGNYELRVDMKRMNNERAAVKYTNFSVGNESMKYRLSVGGYSFDSAFVNPVDNLGYHNGMQFATKNNGNGVYQDYNCAVKYKGAWWYRSCHQSNLNGEYCNTNYGEGLNWYNWTGYHESLIYTRMMIRPN